ncbi:uncharacterized protein A1O5_11394 [Cladophialophora psammophila CBS 110553]|uniref:Methyltransferase n=1 Tax=Cladophialophora psammophila CBS 110553 TaxID=1182543 RepID=W9W6P0_9EURO|nr:uncharacterized protein A1O5_11394 [Cladophialophora psammophila CBS 110553]EXJ63633.1 hypothetical protein A1O5_11394 [Cladophialophora psammophila CBS 110553]
MQEPDDEHHVDHALADNDEDSALDLGDDQISTASITSTIRNFQIENGHTYHALRAGNLQNQHFLATFGGRAHFAPGAETAQRVLDVGTGTGIWAIQYADAHPAAQIIGVDLSPIQPTYVPPNCSFEIDDLEHEWTWSIPFDYIFSRMMVGSFADWPGFIGITYENLTPGGWLELQDCIFPLGTDDGSFHEGQTIYEWSSLLLEASNKLGRSLGAAIHHRDRMIAAGFTNVTMKLFKWPTNSWPKDPKHKIVGMWALANIGSNVEGLSMALLSRVHGWTREQVLAYLPAVRKDLQDNRIHAYWPM